MNRGVLTPEFIFKILEVVILLIAIIISCVFSIELRSKNEALLYMAAVAGYSIAGTLIMIGMVLVYSLSGCVFCIAGGSLLVSNSRRIPQDMAGAGFASGSLCIICGFIFLIDAVYPYILELTTE